MPDFKGTNIPVFLVHK